MIIDEGTIVAQGTPSELKKRYSSDQLILVCQDVGPVAARLEGMGCKYKVVADTVEVAIPSTMASLPLIEACRNHITGFEVVRGTMDDVFIAITGKEIRE